MTPLHLSRLASTLLRFVASNNEPLAGDLLEEYRAGRSGRSFWTQLMGAVLVASWRKRQPSPAIVRLVTTSPYDRPDRTLGLLDPALINLSGTGVRGIGGLGLLAVVVLISLTMPAAWWLLAIGLASGTVLGVVLIMRRRRVGLSGGGDDGPLTLFGSESSQRGEHDDAGSPRGLETSQVHALGNVIQPLRPSSRFGATAGELARAQLQILNPLLALGQADRNRAWRELLQKRRVG